MPLLASFLIFLKPTPEPTSDPAPPTPAVVEVARPQTQRDPFAPILTSPPRRIGMVLGEDGPRALLEGPDGNIYVGALLADTEPDDDRSVLDSRIAMLLRQP